jgi:type VI secretion system protein ImpL
MKDSLLYPLAAVALIICLLLSWFVGTWMHLRSPDVWILRGGLALLSVCAIGGFVWFRARQEAGTGAAGGAGDAGGAGLGAGGSEEIDTLLREAETRLASARLGKGAKLGQLPVILLLGETGSGKTSVVMQSGLDPELLAGQVYQEGATVPTRAANLWFARRVVLAEGGGRLLSDPARWQRLVKRLAPGGLKSLGSGEQAPRAVVVCVDAEALLKPNAAEAVPQTARKLQARLGEISQQLGISFPVYVFFNRMDRVPYFSDFVKNMSHEEAAQVLGVTLPPAPQTATGVYAEQEAKRLHSAFHNLFYALADKRPYYLSRERLAEPIDGVYEFPREFRKLRGLLVPFLVDLARPSQLRTNPFLRGFYFTGMRTIIVAAASGQTSVLPRAATEQFAAPTGSATTFLRREDVFAQAPATADSMESTQVTEGRKVTQWVFLSHLFSDVLLQDRAALGASGTSTKIGYLRRVVLSTVAALGLILSIGLLVSFFGNRSLVTEAQSASGAISTSEAPGNDLASVDSLRRLERLRQSVETLNGYERQGAPFRLRWGLYSGSGIQPDAWRIYFDRFKLLLFGSTQAGLRETLAQLPAVPGPNDVYGPVYDTLKSYLLTTSNSDKEREKGNPEFLSAALYRRWLGGRTVEDDRRQMAEKQFDFYSQELAVTNPFSSENDAGAIVRARNYLKQFAGNQRIYQSMLAAASKNNPGVRFNEKYASAGAGDVVTNGREIPGAFTRSGWKFMQDAIKNPDRYFSGEEWVLGAQTAASIDRTKLEQDLQGMYVPDYLRTWREFLAATRVSGYASYADAAKKLTRTAANSSPLLAALCETSANTAVGAADIEKAFKAVQLIEPANCLDAGLFVQQPNQAYMQGLLSLEQSLDQHGLAPPEGKEAATAQVMQSATQARTAARQVMQAAPIDPEAHLEKSVQKLLEDPITSVLNMGGGGAAFPCEPLRAVMAKYPFNPQATQNADIGEIQRVFRSPDGLLAQQYNSSLKPYLLPQGLRYAPNPTGGKVNPAFLAFFNRAADLQQALFPGGSQEMQYRYYLKPIATEGIESLTLTIDGQTLKAGLGGAAPKLFVWTGGMVQQVRLTVKIKGGSELSFPGYDGPYAVFHFFNDADRWESQGATSTVEWVLRVAGGRPMTMADGRPVMVQFEIDTRGGPAIFQRNYLAGLGCVAKVTQ